ncbi:MAG: AMP-dependent synthetase/ligase [Actinomycetota bacterium]|nr:AMP-dependent synthetase/ligase [Actinomycetota bacterium]
MTEVSVPALYQVPESGSVTDWVVHNAASAPHRAVFARRVADRWQDVTAEEFLTEVRAVSKGLVAAGVAPGDRVALMSKTRYEWTLVDFAVWFAGAVGVPIYETSSAEQVEWILSDSGAVACVVETAAHADVVAQVRERVPDLHRVWEIDGGAVDDLVAAGAEVPDAELEQRRTAVRSADLATIIYTSGTTGQPKGCELTHANFLAEVRNVVGALPELFVPGMSSTLLFLPLAHVFARVIQLSCVFAQTRLAHTSDVKRLVEDFGSYQPTFILAVPRVFEKVYNSSQQKAEAAGKGRIFSVAAETAIAWSEAQDVRGPGITLRLRHALFDRLVYGKLRAALGGRVEYAVSGGAPLGTRLGHFFRGIGITVVEGYGLTETTAAAAANRPATVKIGTVGQPIPGMSIRTADDGEILIKGPVVFRGYYGKSDATREAVDAEGWFHTGDLGSLDEDGFLRITGRKKEILVTAGGKNVAPTVLEDRLRAHPLVSQCVVVGDARPYIACLVTLDADAVPAWLDLKGKPRVPVSELVDDPDVLAEIQAAVDEANRAVSKAEAIKRFRILAVDFTEESGHLTPKLNLKRSLVLKDYASEVDALYR